MITEREWQSIHNAISRSHKPPHIKHSTVTRRDKTNRKVWLHDYGDDPVPMASFEYEIQFHDEQSGKIQVTTLRPKIPDVGETVLVNEPMGSRELVRIVGVVPKKKKSHKDYIFAAKAPDAPAPIPGIPTGGLLWWPGALATSGEEVPTAGYLTCNGAAVARTGAYAALFAILSTTYGIGNGTTTFNLPNLVGRTPIGASGSFARGSAAGASTVTLSEAEMPTHFHPGSAAGVNYMVFLAGGSEAFPTVTGSSTLTNSNKTGDKGGGQAHNNMQPYQALGGMIIKF